MSKPRVRLRSGNIGSSINSFRPAGKYEAAGNGRRTEQWARASNEGPVNAIENSLDTLRKRSRYEVQNNPYARRGRNAMSASAIGSGIKPSIQDPTVSALWQDFVEQSDADGVLDFYGMQSLAVSEIFEAGEALTRFRARRPSDGLPVAMQLQMLEGEHLPTMSDYRLPRYTRSGIEFGPVGQRSAYHLYTRHPGDPDFLTGGLEPDIRRVRAQSVMHTYLPDRIGAIRGVPWLAQAIMRLHDLDSYQDAELVKSKTRALLNAFIKTPAADDGPSMFEGEEDHPDDEGAVVAPLEPGGMSKLAPGEDVTFVNPNDVGGSYEPFVKSQFRAISAATGVPYEVLTGDYSGVNDRTLRHIMQWHRREIQPLQRVVINTICRPTWRAFLDTAELEGKLPRGKRAVDFYGVQWVPQPFAHIHPLQETENDLALIGAKLKSRTQVHKERGTDFSQTLEELAAEEKMLADRGFVSDPTASNSTALPKMRSNEDDS